MSASRQITVVFSVLLIACIAGSVLLLRGLDRLRSHATLEEVLYISSPKAIKRLSLGYDGLLADIYWTRAVQYFGNKHNVGAENFNLLAPLLEITTALDPHLVVAYEYGSNFLAPQPPNGAGMPDRAIKLDEFGIRNNPDEWRLYYDLGFIYYTELHDYAHAADAFSRGSRVPHAHPFMTRRRKNRSAPMLPPIYALCKWMKTCLHSRQWLYASGRKPASFRPVSESLRD